MFKSNDMWLMELFGFVGPCAAFPHMFRHVSCHLSFKRCLSFSVPSVFTTHCLPAGSVLCLEVVAVEAVVVGAAVRLRLHPFHLHCQSINLQTIATGEKKC